MVFSKEIGPEQPDDRKPAVSVLMDLQTKHWLPTCTTGLVDLLNVIGPLTDLQVDQEQLPEDLLGDEVTAGLTDAGAGAIRH